MKKDIYEKIEIPEGVQVEIARNQITVSGKEGKISKNVNLAKIELKKEGNKIVIGGKNMTKTEKKMIYTIISHLKNMIQGVEEKYTYEVKICFNHFPITLDIVGNEAKIKNFLGERIPRKAKILDDVEVEVKKDSIIVKSVDKEAAGQTAANFEAATRIKNRDRRVFQDGLFIINKCGKAI
jgi:large subunit ribosomal protein L6